MAKRKPPRMTYFRWMRTQGVEVGATGQHAWYWRCPRCRHWAGPDHNIAEAKGAAMRHKHHAH